MSWHRIKTDEYDVVFYDTIPHDHNIMAAFIGDELITITQKEDGYDRKGKPKDLFWMDYNTRMERKIRERCPEIKPDLSFPLWEWVDDPCVHNGRAYLIKDQEPVKEPLRIGLYRQLALFGESA